MSKSEESTSSTETATKAARATVGPADDAVAAEAGDNDAAGRSGRDSGDLLVAMSPRQIIGGFAVLAGLILMLRRRRRDKS